LRVEEASNLIMRIQKMYDRKPEEDWRILIGRDRAGCLTQLIADSSNCWQIKGEIVRPGKFAGVGARLSGVDSRDMLDMGQPLYGVRPLSGGDLKAFLEAESTDKLEELATFPRTPFREALEADAIIEGPVMQTRSPIGPVSEKQRRLEISLNRGLDNLMRREHPETRLAYG
jgi:hypothetical protein